MEILFSHTFDFPYFSNSQRSWVVCQFSANWTVSLTEALIVLLFPSFMDCEIREISGRAQVCSSPGLGLLRSFLIF